MIGPFSGLDEAKELGKRDVVASYKACEQLDGKRLLVFGLLGALAVMPAVMPPLRHRYATRATARRLLPAGRAGLLGLSCTPHPCPAQAP